MLGLIKRWKNEYTRGLLEEVKLGLNQLGDWMRNLVSRLNGSFSTLEEVQGAMALIQGIRAKESVIEWEFAPVEKKYDLLNRHGVKGLSAEERDELKNLWKSWGEVKQYSDELADNLHGRQGNLRQGLIHDVAYFQDTADRFCEEFQTEGPGVSGISAEEAIERLREQESHFATIERNLEKLNAGECLFGLPRSDHGGLNATRKELKLYKQLYDLYEVVMNTEDEYRNILWVDVVANIEAMLAQVNEFQRQCKNMPKALKE